MMNQTYTYGEKARQFLVVFLPIFVTQLALMAPGFFNTVMAGHVSEQDLAGVAVGANLFFPALSGALGVISGLTPVLAQLCGAGKRHKIGHIVQQGFYWALALAALFLGTGGLLVPLLLPALGLEAKVACVATHYLMFMSCGVPFLFLSAVLRNFLDSHGRTRLTMLITLCTVPFNILVSFLLMYGHLGLPAFGGIGAGIGSGLTFCLNFLLSVLVVSHASPFREYRVFRHLPKPNLREWRKQLAVGIPIGSTIFCENSIFGAVGLLVAVYGTAVLAAHQSAMNFTTIIYMFPLSVSMALTILVGFEAGARRIRDAGQYIRLTRISALVIVSLLAWVLTFFRNEIAALYTTSPEVQDILKVFLTYAVFMQVVDSLNAPLQGALRGYKDVKPAFCLAVLSFWIIGLPGGWLLAHPLGFGPAGYWWGLIGGTLIGAICLQIRLLAVERKFSSQDTQ